MSQADYGVVACVRKRDIRGDPYPGSRVYYCARCRYEVWASPASQHLIAEGLPILCLACVPQVVAETDDVVTEVRGTENKLRHYESMNIKPWPFERGSNDS